MIPSKQQWRKWTLPSKASYLGPPLAVIGITVSLVLYWVWPDSNHSTQTGFGTESELREVRELLIAQQAKVRVIGDLGVTVNFADFLNQLEDLGFDVQVTKFDSFVLMSGRSMSYPPEMQEAADMIARVLPPPFSTDINPSAPTITVMLGPDWDDQILVSSRIGGLRAERVVERLKGIGIVTTFVTGPACQIESLQLAEGDIEWGDGIRSQLLPILPALRVEISDNPMLTEYRAILCLDSND